jgi:multidrug efflux pump
VITAVQAQNAEVSAGELGGTPSLKGQQLNATVSAQSRLQTAEQFGAILLKTTTDGAMVHLKDVAPWSWARELQHVARYNGHAGIRRGDQAGTGRQRARYRQRGESHVEQPEQAIPEGLSYRWRSTPPRS